MIKEVLNFLLLFVLMMALQVLICNHIALFNVAVPIIFIYFLIRLPVNLGNGWLFTIAFLTGLCVDICADTPGVNALACLVMAALKRPVFFAYVPRDDKTRDIIPSVSTLGIAVYSKFLLTLVAIYCVLAFSIEYFNFSDIQYILILSASSCALTFIMLLAIDCLIINKP